MVNTFEQPHIDRNAGIPEQIDRKSGVFDIVFHVCFCFTLFFILNLLVNCCVIQEVVDEVVRTDHVNASVLFHLLQFLSGIKLLVGTFYEYIVLHDSCLRIAFCEFSPRILFYRGCTRLSWNYFRVRI